jgi:hypothetical protein
MFGMISERWRSAWSFGGAPLSPSGGFLSGAHTDNRPPIGKVAEDLAKTLRVTPYYYALDCITDPGGELKVIDVHGGVGGGLTMLATAYPGKAAARDRLLPYLRRLGEVGGGKRVLFVHDLFTTGQTFPDDFFNWVQRYIAYGPVTDWVPDLQEYRRRQWETPRAPEVEQMGLFLDPLAARLRLKIAYCTAARVQYQFGEPRLLLSGYREKARHRGESRVVRPEEIGVVVFTGPTERFPEDLKQQDWFPLVNPPTLDQLFENKWLLPALLEGTPAADLLPRWIPVGMGLRTAGEVRDFSDTLHSPSGFPLAVLKPSHLGLSLGVRFLDRTGLRALISRQPEGRLPAHLAEECLDPQIQHTYDEVTAYRGKQLDNLLRAEGAAVHDHGDGTFHYSAPYPFLESTVGILQEYVEARPVRSRKTGQHHRGYTRVVMFDGKVVAALHRLDQEPDDGSFRDITRQNVKTFFEGANAEDEAFFQEQLGPFFQEVENQFHARIQNEADLIRLRDRWVLDQTAAHQPAHRPE